MKSTTKWLRWGALSAPVLGMLVALAAFVAFAGPNAARAQGPAPGEPTIGSDEGGAFEIDLEDEVAEFGDGPLAFFGPGGPGPDMDLAPRGGGPGMGGMPGGMHGRMHGAHGGMGAGRGAHRAEMMEKLKLTPQQKEKMADLRDAQQRKMIGIRGGLAEARLDMRRLMRAETPSQAQIDATIDRMAKLRADAQKSRIATRLAMRGLLTDSQRKTLDEMRVERRGAGMGGGNGPGGRGGRRGV